MNSHASHAGYIDRRPNVITKEYNILYDALDARINPADGPWATVCEAHGTICNHPSLAAAGLALASSWLWCEDCVRLIEQQDQSSSLKQRWQGINAPLCTGGMYKHKPRWMRFCHCGASICCPQCFFSRGPCFRWPEHSPNPHTSLRIRILTGTIPGCQPVQLKTIYA